LVAVACLVEKVGGKTSELMARVEAIGKGGHFTMEILNLAAASDTTNQKLCEARQAPQFWIKQTNVFSSTI
jgi:hypothetical protein